MKLQKKDIFNFIGWGFTLWFIGYILGFVFFMLLPQQYIGWAITPIGIVITLWVLFKKINTKTLRYYFMLAVCWTIIVALFDYLFIVQLLKPADGYYKLDVSIYYILTFLLPIIVGVFKVKLEKATK